MLQWLIDIDTQLFLAINSRHNAFFDVVMYWVSNKFTWIPLYGFLLYLLVKEYKKAIPVAIVFTVLLITISDKLTSGLIKPVVKRLRPCHNELLDGLVHINRNCGGQYGFMSSHAANSFALALFSILLLGEKYKWINYVMPLWAILVSYSRIYNGVHYPGDVISGAEVGALLGLYVAFVFKRYYKKQFGSSTSANTISG